MNMSKRQRKQEKQPTLLVILKEWSIFFDRFRSSGWYKDITRAKIVDRDVRIDENITRMSKLEYFKMLRTADRMRTEGEKRPFPSENEGIFQTSININIQVCFPTRI